MWIKLQNEIQRVAVDLRVALAPRAEDGSLVGVVNIINQLARESTDCRMCTSEFLTLVKAIDDLKDHAVCLFWVGDHDLARSLFKAIDELNAACEDCADYCNFCFSGC